jgi:hypothetical protein
LQFGAPQKRFYHPAGIRRLGLAGDNPINFRTLDLLRADAVMALIQRRLEVLPVLMKPYADLCNLQKAPPHFA